MNVLWRPVIVGVALATAMAGNAYAMPEFGANCTSCHSQRADGAVNFVPSDLLAITAGDMGQITFDVTDIGNSGNAALALVGLDAAGLMATPDLTNWNEQIDGTVNYLTSNLFNAVGPIVLKLTIGANATPADYLINLTLAGLDTKRWSTTRVFTVRVAAAGLIGDYNGNGTVDAADYTVWRNTLGSTSDLTADGSGNNVIDAADYDVWKTNFGQTAGSGAVTIDAVPEPATAAMLLVGVWAMMIWRRRS